MDTILGEMEEDAKEDEQFRKSTNVERAFLFWRQFFDLKKYCILAFLLALILAVQLTALFAPAITPEGKELFYAAWKDYFNPAKCCPCDDPKE